MTIGLDENSPVDTGPNNRQSTKHALRNGDFRHQEEQLSFSFSGAKESIASKTEPVKKEGGPDWTRTSDPCVISTVL